MNYYYSWSSCFYERVWKLCVLNMVICSHGLYCMNGLGSFKIDIFLPFLMWRLDMVTCSNFISKWFDGPEKTTESFKKDHVKKVVTATFTLTSNDSKGLISYASSPGVNSLLRSMLWFHSGMHGPNKVLKYSTLNGDALRLEELYIPTVDTLFSDKRKGRLVVAPSTWGPSDSRQPFNVEAPRTLLLSITYSHGEIRVVGTFHKNILSVKTISN